AQHYGNATAESLEYLAGESHVPKHGSTEDIFLGMISGITSTIYGIGATAYNAIAWSYSLQVTVQSLLDGLHYESDKVDEVLTGEQLIRAGVQSLNERIKVLSTFEGQDQPF